MFFDDLTQKEINILEKKGQRRSYEAGTYIIKEGSMGSTLSIILSGKVEVRKKLSEKHSKAVTVLNALDLVGELGFFGASARSADAVAITRCELFEFTPEAFQAVTKSNPKLGVKLYRNMAKILAYRIADTDSELRDAVIWSCEHERDRVRLPDIRQNYKLTLKNP